MISKKSVLHNSGNVAFETFGRRELLILKGTDISL